MSKTADVTSKNCHESFGINSVSKYFHNQDIRETYEYLTVHFRRNWDYGLSAAFDSRKYFNLLVSFFREINEILTISNIIKIILDENGDLGNISYSKLVDNLNQNYKKLYRKRL